MAVLDFGKALFENMVQDTYTATDAVAVTIVSPKRKEDFGDDCIVQGVLLEDLEINVNSEWEDAMGKAANLLGGLPSLVENFDLAAQAFAGYTARQPWLSREVFKGVHPLEFSVTFRFVADKTQKNVVKDVNRLVAFAFPRKSGVSDGSLGTKLGLGSFVDFYHIPGPGPFFGIGGNKSGDYLDIYIGEFFKWRACYINTITGFISASCNSVGYPNYAELKVTFRCMDCAYVDSKTGTFNLFEGGYSSLTEGIVGEGMVAGEKLKEEVFTKMALRVG